MNSLLRSFTSFATQTRPSTLLRAAPFGFIQPALVRGFKVRTSVKKFCDQCYVSDHRSCLYRYIHTNNPRLSEEKVVLTSTVSQTQNTNSVKVKEIIVKVVYFLVHIVFNITLEIFTG